MKMMNGGKQNLQHHPHAVNIYIITTILCIFMTIWILILPSSALQDYPEFFPYLDRMRREIMIDNQHDFLPRNLVDKFRGHKAVHFTHILPAAIWSVLIPFQFHAKFRRKYRQLHVMFGYIFLLSCVLMSAGVVLILKRNLLFENFVDRGDGDGDGGNEITTKQQEKLDRGRRAGVSSTVIFLCFLSLWFIYTAAVAFYCATKKRFHLHQKWLIRHVASGIWVAIQRALIGFVFAPIIIFLYMAIKQYRYGSKIIYLEKLVCSVW